MATEVEAAPWPHEEYVGQDRQCVNCGYNLRTLSTAGQCPECGMQVAHSLHNNELRFCNRRWLGRLRWGVRVEFWVVLVLLGYRLFLLGFKLLPAGLNSSVLWVLSALGNLMVLLAGFINIVPVWLLTAPDPRLETEARDNRIRRLLRGWIGVVVVAELGQMGLRFGVGYYLSYGYVFLAQFLLDFPGILFTGLFLYYLRLLAWRIPSAPLARQAAWIFWGLTLTALSGPISAVWFYVNNPLLTVAARPLLPTSYELYFVVMFLFSNGAMIINFLFLNFLARMDQALDEAIEHADMNLPKGNAYRGQ